MATDMAKATSNPPATQRPKRKPGKAGLRAGELMRGGDAKPRRAARLKTDAHHP